MGDLMMEKKSLSYRIPLSVSPIELDRGNVRCTDPFWSSGICWNSALKKPALPSNFTLFPVFYAAFLLAITYHALVTLFMDYSGGYEERIKRLLPLVVTAITFLVVIVTAPSGFFGKARLVTFHI